MPKTSRTRAPARRRMTAPPDDAGAVQVDLRPAPPRPLLPTHAGLCTNCDNRATCTYPALSGTPILQCEEYVLRAPMAETAECGNPRPSRRPRETAPPAVVDRTLGLCSNCAKAATCTFPKPEGGVWRCEEYA